MTQTQLKKTIHYEPTTGIFTRIVRNHRFGPIQCNDVMNSTDCKQGYYRGFIDGKHHYLHRLAFLYMTGSMPLGSVDHIDHNIINNRWDNLRDVSHRENTKNRSFNKNNTSGHIGVRLHTTYKRTNRERWVAHIAVNRKKMTIGYYDTIDEAIVARKAAEVRYGFHPGHGS